MTAVLDHPLTVHSSTLVGVQRLWMLTEFAVGPRQQVCELLWSAIPGDRHQPERPDTSGVSYWTQYIPQVPASLDLVTFHPVAATGQLLVPGVRMHFTDPDTGRAVTLSLAVPDADLAEDGTWVASDRDRFLNWAGIHAPGTIPAAGTDLPARIGLVAPRD